MTPHMPGREYPTTQVSASSATLANREHRFISDTTSLKSSMKKYQWEHGRRYHAENDSTYW